MNKSPLSAILKKYGFIVDKPYEQIIWNYVTKDGKYMLKQTRNKESDPERRGQDELPSGHVKKYEWPLRTGRREIYEETDVWTVPCIGKNKLAGLTDKALLLPRENITIILQPDGRIWAKYSDSGKAYTGFLMGNYVPVTPPKQKNDECLDPKYIEIEDFLDGKNCNFIPTHRIYAELIGANDFKRSLKHAEFINADGLEEILKIGEPEYQTFMDFLKPVCCDE
jgi:hypothetical protein